MAGEQDPEFEALLQFLKDSRGFDFTGYKRSSLVRRVERRMQQAGAASYAEYLDLLETQPDEFTALFNTILINVTGFFRDPDAWNHLRDDALPAVLAELKPTDPIRVWSAGCASGEEAYTIAIILAELLGSDQFRDRVKIYATDVDEEALSQGRHATYSEAAVKGVPPELRDHYFEQQGQRYSFRTDLRRAVIFGRNDLVQDAPISRVHLLVCRNTLMYFNAETQARIVNRFHFAMHDEALLFLGKAEMLLSHSELFKPLDLKRRLFRRVPRPHVNGGRYIASNGFSDSLGDMSAATALRIEALATSPLATLLVTTDGTLASSNQRADVMFGLAPRDIGRPFRDLEVSYRPVELRAHIDEAIEQRRPAWLRDVEAARGPLESLFLDIAVTPLIAADGSVLGAALHFTDVSRNRKLQNELELTNRQLETAYEELQSTVEELETTNEELQSTVEELETTNEELQSTNEELETMNEEMQSTNDELQTINDELQLRTDDLNNANGFLESVLRTLSTAVIVVDPELTVTAWNRRAEDLWGLRPNEAVGHHLLNLDVGIAFEQVRPLLRAALAGSAVTDVLTLDGVNRRGRAISVEVRCAALATDGDTPGAIVLIDET
jgi:two-component system CheB/CheR fusion protein